MMETREKRSEVRAALRPAEAARALGISRSTLYTIPWLMQRSFIPKGTRGRRWDPAVIEMYKELRRAG